MATVADLAAVRSIRTAARRAYVQTRRPQWRQGRTWAKDAQHLAGGNRLAYRPALYVAMDGEPANWWCDGAGNVHPRGAARTNAAGRVAEVEDPAAREAVRARLGWWVTRPELPRIVLVGEPGEGKTTFLTRLAAELGARAFPDLLDPDEAPMPQVSVAPAGPALPPEFDFDRLRTAAGRIPVPVVVEALAIADCLEQRSGAAPDPVGGLVRAVTQALHGDTPTDFDEQAVRADLAPGNYLVLVDGWDEILEEQRRTGVLTELSALPQTLPGTRLVLTTRSERFTGRVSFAPALEVVRLRPLTDEQRNDLIGRWVADQHAELPEEERPDFAAGLVAAVARLGEILGPTGEEEELIANPLLLTAICAVYRPGEKALPNDRSQLCEMVVEDLCGGVDTDGIHGVLGPVHKLRILRRLALGAPREPQAARDAGGAGKGRPEGAQDLAQDWAQGEVEEEFAGAQRDVDPASLFTLTARAALYLNWTMERTGLLISSARGGLRFRHRVFRDYLAACALAEQMADANAVRATVAAWWAEGAAAGGVGKLTDGAWEDVMRLLPGPLKKERGLAWRAALRDLAPRAEKRAGRLLGLAAAAVVETRRHFKALPGVEWVLQAEAMAQEYARVGLSWPRGDRLFFLDMLGRLVLPCPAGAPGGDPRLWGPQEWVELGPGQVLLEGEQKPRDVAAFAMAWAPVTVQEYAEFVAAPDGGDGWWGEADADGPATPDDERKRVHERSPADWERQKAHPNRPVVEVSWWEARAYCRWRTACARAAGDARAVRLPTEEEWQLAAAGANPIEAREYPWGPAGPQRGDAAQSNWSGDAPSPVGAFAATAEGVVDLSGNVLQWCSAWGRDEDRRVVRGGSWSLNDAGLLRCAFRNWYPPEVRFTYLGLRVVRAAGTD